MYKVFINDSSLEFISSASVLPEGTILFKGIKQLSGIIDKLEREAGIQQLVIAHEDPDHVWEDFVHHFSIIEAAGGIVKNGSGEILMIFRLGKWDLPKGKVEEEESIEETALREVEEECGIKDLSIIRELPVMYHTYLLNGQRILKRTYWFEMQTEYSPNLVPQIEEHIEKAQWVNPDFLNEYMGNTYASIRWLLRKVIPGMNDLPS